MQAQAVLDAKGNPTGEYTYNGSVANRALELLGKEQGMFVERKEVGGPGAFSELNEELQQAIIRAHPGACGTRPGVRRVRETVGATETRDQALKRGELNRFSVKQI